MKNLNHYLVYDDRLDLVYEAKLKADQGVRDEKLNQLLKKSSLFLHLENMMCYRVMPQLR